jgi:signal peptidase I
MDTDAQPRERGRAPDPDERQRARSRSSRTPDASAPDLVAPDGPGDGPGDASPGVPRDASPDMSQVASPVPPDEASHGAPPPTGRWTGWFRWATGGGPWRRAALAVGFCVLVVLLTGAFVMQPFLIPSASMENTLRPGDRVLVDKLAYRFGGEPRRGDVVVFDGAGSFAPQRPPGNRVLGALRAAAASAGLVAPAESDFVKRVIGVGGDHVTCCDKRGRIKVNGQPVDEDYLFVGDAPSQAPFDIVVPQGRLWVMGDHRSDSADSRAFLGAPGGGTVPVGEVIGRVDWIAWPPGHWTRVHRSAAFARVPGPGAARPDGRRG